MKKTTAQIKFQIEEASLNAWPSLKSFKYDGWLLRFANGYTKRANSVNILGPSKIKLAQKIKHCEYQYRKVGLPTLFRLTDIKPLIHIEKALTDMGYIKIEPTLVLVLNVNEIKYKQFCALCEFKSQILDIWLKHYFQIGKFNKRSFQTHRQIIKNVIPRYLLAELDYKGIPVSTGMAVLEKHFAGLFDIFTLKEKRQQGFGMIMLNGLLQWALINGAKLVYLQVVDANCIALNMYNKFGFRKAYSYCYYVHKTELNRIPNPR
jgi:GNAT superfamily N-acetyltransferase